MSKKSNNYSRAFVVFVFLFLSFTFFLIILISKFQSDTKSEKPNYLNNKQNWTTYNSIDLGFRIKYPSNWFIAEAQNNKLIISNHKNFEKEETALVITIEQSSENNMSLVYEDTSRLNDELGYKKLMEKYPNEFKGSAFVGDPPWGYHYLYFETNKEEEFKKMIQIIIRLHSIDDLPKTESGLEGSLKAQAKEIISTLEIR